MAPGARPPESLQIAAAASPIVLWPAHKPADRSDFWLALAQAWPNVPSAVHEARFRTPCAKSELSGVRMVWDDPDWINLARMNNYG